MKPGKGLYVFEVPQGDDLLGLSGGCPVLKPEVVRKRANSSPMRPAQPRRLQIQQRT